MKLRDALILLVMGCGASTEQYVLRVDRVFDAKQPSTPDGELGYNSASPVDRWDVTVDGSQVVLVKRDGDAQRIEGVESGSTQGVRRFDLNKGVFAGGRFMISPAKDGELTIFGSGVPIVASERGKLVTR